MDYPIICHEKWIIPLTLLKNREITWVSIKIRDLFRKIVDLSLFMILIYAILFFVLSENRNRNFKKRIVRKVYLSNLYNLFPIYCGST